ncbi:xylulokinase [Stutzerimonas urumqiensis]|uniref:xylulokinase n=1 Tax=Stutzerimonas urumqiensis TaxID=638269 RepID=UPI000EB4378D|nr:xylulokinase [Stutzerimonas urumqiensis]
MFLGIDCGTQGTKAVVLDADTGQVLGEGAAPHSLLSGSNGRREQDVRQWTDALVAATHTALARAGLDGERIRGVGVSGQQHGLVLLDERGQPLRPAKLWCDTESTPQNERLLDWLGGPEGSLARLGVAIAPGYTVSKLLWTLEHYPDLIERTAHILLPHDYLNFWLTGRCVTEFGDASGTGYFDVRARRWDRELLRHIDPAGRLERALPTLIEPDGPAGKLRPEAAALLGLAPGVLVSSGGGDNMMAAIGTGNISPGSVTVGLGTSGTLYAYSDTPAISPHPAVATFCSSSGGWLSLICTMNLTNANAAVRELLGVELDHFEALVAQAPIGADGLTLLPYFNGERVPPLPNATGTLTGMRIDNLSRPNLCRAVMEGVTYGLRYGFDLLRDSGIECRRVRLVGGGARSAVWTQMIADVLAVEVVRGQQTEAGALGAALQVAWCHARTLDPQASLAELCQRCVGLGDEPGVQPDSQAVLRYEQAYRRYRAALDQMHGLAQDAP